MAHLATQDADRVILTTLLKRSEREAKGQTTSGTLVLRNGRVRLWNINWNVYPTDKHGQRFFHRFTRIVRIDSAVKEKPTRKGRC